MSTFIADPQAEMNGYYPNGTLATTGPGGAPLVGTPTDSLSQPFSALSTWFMAPNTSTLTTTGAADGGGEDFWQYSTTTFTPAKTGAPGSGDTAFIIGPGTITGAGAAGTLGLDGTLTIAADLTVTTLLAGAVYQGVTYQVPEASFSRSSSVGSETGPDGLGGLPNDGSRSLNGSQVTTFQSATVTSDTPTNLSVQYYSPTVSGSLFGGPSGTSQPRLLSTVSAASNDFAFTGTIEAQTGTLAFATIDVSGLVSFAAQDGADLTDNATLTIDAGGNLESASLTLDPNQNNVLRIDAGGTLGLSGGAIGSNGALGLDDEGIATILGGTLASSAAVIEVGMNAAATLTIAQGASAAAENTVIGSDGTLAVSGAGTKYQDTGNGAMTVNGTLTLDAGALLLDGSATIGADSGDSGLAIVDGATWTLTDGLTVGESGSGTLALSNQGSVQVGGAIEIGAKSGGAGLLSVASAATMLAESTVTAGSVQGSSGTISLDGGSTTLTVDGNLALGEQGSGTLDITTGATLVALGAIDVGNASNGGQGVLSSVAGQIIAENNLAIDNGSGTIETGSSLALAGELSAGGAAGGSGTLLIQSGAEVSGTSGVAIGGQGTGDLTLTGGATIVGAAASVEIGGKSGGTGTLDMSGAGALLDAASLTVGGSGTGTFDLGGGATVTLSNKFSVGESAGGVGLATLDGVGTEMTVGNGIAVGGGGQGLLLLNGAFVNVTGGAISVGESLGGVGSFVISAGTLGFGGTLGIGAAGNGIFEVQLGAAVDGLAKVSLGESSGGVGQLVLNQGALESTSLTVGSLGQATLDLTGQSSLTTEGNAKIADQSTSVVQRVIINDSAWEATGSWTAGDAGAANVLIEAAGTVTGLGGAKIGDQAGANGDVTVQGQGSALDFGGALVVGGSGAGTLTLRNGASAGPVGSQPGTIEIGADTGGSGTISLAGAGTALHGTALYVGGKSSVAGGSGDLVIGSGGEVGATKLKLWQQGTVDIAGGTLTTSTVTLAQGGTISGSGTISGAITNDGSIIATGGTLDLTGAISGSGSLVVGSGAILSLGSTVGGGETIDFASGSGTLALADPAGFAATIDRIAPNDAIVLTQAGYDALDRVTLASGNVLAVTNATGTIASLHLDPASSYAGETFSLGNSGAGAETITVIPCFVRGTRIRTIRGDVPVEALIPGEQVITADGDRRPVRWIGRRQIDLTRHPHPENVYPVRILADSFAAGLPARDLWVSPGHSLLVEGVLIPAEHLVNGATIRRERVEQVEYFHVELDRHDILLSEALASESYLDTGNRAAFANAGEPAVLHPDFSARPHGGTCAPLLVEGPLVGAARERLLARVLALGFRRSAEHDLHLAVAGQRIAPARQEGTWFTFSLPAWADDVRITSQVAVPAGLDPSNDDCRSLGARVDAIVLDGAPLPLESPILRTGFHAIERSAGGAWRWTDGSGLLALPRCGLARTLRVEVSDMLPHWEPPISLDRRARRG